jgi:hypothetical protein
LKTYNSKISYALLLGILGMFITIILVEISNQTSNFTATAILIFTYIFILHLFYTTKYIIDDGILKIRSGFIHKLDIEIQSIKSISKTNSIMSSPAASFDRIEIKFGKFDSVLISPKDKIAFINNLVKINPNIKNEVTLN